MQLARLRLPESVAPLFFALALVGSLGGPMAGRAHAADAPPLSAFAPCAWGSDDCNVCVADPVAAIQSLRDHGDILGFHMNSAPDVTASKHWQGVQRLMGGGGRYLAVSRSLPSESTDVSFVVVEMASRDATGLRFRSNRLAPGRSFVVTPPPLADGIIAVVPHEPGFTHAGGMQALGNLLAVPFEDGGTSKVVFWDVANPPNPVRLSNEVPHAVAGGISSEAGTATFAKLGDGRFLLVIGRASANTLDFYVSATQDPRTTTYERFDTWNESELESEICGAFGCTCGAPGTDCDFGGYQNVNAVNGCDGTLYLVGTHADLGGGLGADFADLYRVENGAGNDVRITKVAKRHLFCSYRGDTFCEGDAAGGVYVDPNGRLLTYLTEHDNDGPLDAVPACSGPACSVKLEEFRPIPHGTCTRIQDAWVELFDNENFGDRGLMIDFVDRALEDYTNYDRVDGFEDKTTSVVWCLPPGATYRLWENKNSCGGDHRDLVGTGALASIANLGGFGDETSCSEWLGGPFADAGPDATAECASPGTTPVALDGRASVVLGSGPPIFEWQAAGVVFDDSTSATPTGAFPKGATVVTLTIFEGAASNTDTVTVNVVDTTPPSLACPTDLLAECSAQGGSSGTDPAVAAFLAGAQASDVCDGDLAVTSDAPAFLGLGSTLVTFTVTDDDGHTATCQATLTVADTTPPVLDPAFAVTPSVLWPPNHRLVTMGVPAVVAVEICDPEPDLVCAVESSQPTNGTGDGDTPFDIVFDGQEIFTQGTGPRAITATGGIGQFTLGLRSERGASLGDRTYATSCIGTDASGNTSAPVGSLVTVPKEAPKP